MRVSLRPLAGRTPSPLPPAPHRQRAFHLARIHLPNQWPSYTPYPLASELQSVLAAPHHAYKASSSSTSSPAPASGDAPNPVLLSFTPPPTYTLGRRQRSLTPDQLATLSAPLSVQSPPLSSPSPDPLLFTPEIHHSLRGGLTTYHGPGQLVFWPVVDLRSPLHPHLSVRAYASLLEDVTASLLSSRFGIATFRDPDNPGVWVRSSSCSSSSSSASDSSSPAPQPTPRPDRKIAALGIHLRRHVATLGLALNLFVPTTGSPHVNPWSRFVPCGIPDRDVTSVAAELGLDTANPEPYTSADKARWSLLEPALVAEEWADEFHRRLRAGA